MRWLVIWEAVDDDSSRWEMWTLENSLVKQDMSGRAQGLHVERLELLSNYCNIMEQNSYCLDRAQPTAQHNATYPAKSTLIN